LNILLLVAEALVEQIEVVAEALVDLELVLVMQ
jgi:hypothetical protein